MKTNKGFTLIEVAVVLAIIAILAAILTPIVTSYIDQSRDTRAGADVKKIAEAVLLYKRDTSKWPAFDTLAAANASTTASRNCLTSGPSAALPTGTNEASWATECGSSIGMLSGYLNVNSLGVTSGNAAGGAVSFRGPYLDGAVGTDPWANNYVVTSKYLVDSGVNNSFWAYAASAGPNGGLDTAHGVAHAGQLTAASDDVIAAIK
jgi:prepilin-type N-terminal cleavage/methylation domain-containing protein